MKKIIFTICLMVWVTLTFAQSKKNSSNHSSTILRGKALYTQYCLPCHQVDGSGVMNMNPPLIQTSFVLGDPKRIINILLKGYNKGVTIDGDDYTNPMPSFSYLNNQQIADILTFVRNSFGNKASPINAEQVKAERLSK